MPCYTPLKAHRIRNGVNDYGITFNPNSTDIVHSLSLPCGSCIGCKKTRARDWAVRCTHEASMYEDNSFITLTYNEENIPKDGSLNHIHFQKFMKRLRKFIKNSDDRKVKYFMCGEYGENYERPHYHLCLFNYRFPDEEAAGISKSGDPVYSSKILENLWKKGYCNYGEVTFQSAAYVAGYIDKKINGKNSKDYYGDRKPEYTTCSNGIGKTWFQRYYSDVYPHDQVICKGKDSVIKLRPPRYYDKLYEEMAPKDMEFIKQKREEHAHLLENHPDNQPKRLLTRYQAALLNKKDIERNLGQNLLDSKISSIYKKDTEKINFLKKYHQEV